ncbi:hypothetical protein HanPSC8_Chr09g0402211 [Helianthus annuus]|nr:hypothetical protein HanPSC8_Chr09g0402211 [Helianthus annuus]
MVLSCRPNTVLDPSLIPMGWNWEVGSLPLVRSQQCLFFLDI